MTADAGNDNGSKAAKALITSGYLLPWLASAVLVWYITTRETPRRLEKAEVKIEKVSEKVNSHESSIKVVETRLNSISTGINEIKIAIRGLDRRRRPRSRYSSDSGGNNAEIR